MGIERRQKCVSFLACFDCLFFSSLVTLWLYKYEPVFLSLGSWLIFLLSSSSYYPSSSQSPPPSQANLEHKSNSPLLESTFQSSNTYKHTYTYTYTLGFLHNGRHYSRAAHPPPAGPLPLPPGQRRRAEAVRRRLLQLPKGPRLRQAHQPRPRRRVRQAAVPLEPQLLHPLARGQGQHGPPRRPHPPARLEPPRRGEQRQAAPLRRQRRQGGQGRRQAGGRQHRPRGLARALRPGHGHGRQVPQPLAAGGGPARFPRLHGEALRPVQLHLRGAPRVHRAVPRAGKGPPVDAVRRRRQRDAPEPLPAHQRRADEAGLRQPHLAAHGPGRADAALPGHRRRARDRGPHPQGQLLPRAPRRVERAHRQRLRDPRALDQRRPARRRPPGHRAPFPQGPGRRHHPRPLLQRLLRQGRPRG